MKYFELTHEATVIPFRLRISALRVNVFHYEFFGFSKKTNNENNFARLNLE